MPRSWSGTVRGEINYVIVIVYWFEVIDWLKKKFIEGGKLYAGVGNLFAYKNHIFSAFAESLEIYENTIIISNTYIGTFIDIKIKLYEFYYMVVHIFN